MPTRTVVLSILLLAGLPDPASAWGFEAHKFIMERAIALLPAEIRPFFVHHQTSIVEHVIDPDLWRTAGWEQEPPRHFLDLDAYGPYPFAKLPRDYGQAVAQHGEAFVIKNGLVPWRSAEIYGKLVEAFTLKAGYSRDNIKFFSSILTHYVSDAHVPLHAVLNYDGQLTGQGGVHSRFESEMFDRYRLKLRIAPKPVVALGPMRDVIFDTLLASYQLAGPVLDADRAAVSGLEYYDGEYFSRLFGKLQPVIEQRLAESITVSASAIASAWVQAGKLPLPIEQSRSPRRVAR